MRSATDTPPARPQVRLRPNRKKITEAILFLIEESERRRLGSPTQYDIAKTIFIADTMHLNEFGRPITYDNYHAMKDGPVPSATYDLLKSGRSATARSNLPWEIMEEGNKMYFIKAKRSPNLRALSRSDCDALSAALQKIKRMRYDEIRRLTHDHPAYLDAWRDEGPRSFPMRYELLLENPNLELALEVEYASRHQ
jgi:uncharacterized phage-associated protein